MSVYADYEQGNSDCPQQGPTFGGYSASAAGIPGLCRRPVAGPGLFYALFRHPFENVPWERTPFRVLGAAAAGLLSRALLQPDYRGFFQVRQGKVPGHLRVLAAGGFLNYSAFGLRIWNEVAAPGLF